MKIRTREINILSMSALDMFCSALGAFMFLALLYIPFAPNLGPKATSVAEMEKKIELLQKERDELQKGLKKQATDIVIVIDGSGSMQLQLDGLSEQIGMFAHVLSRLTDSARVAVVVYRDRCEPGTMLQVQPFTRVDDAGVQALQAFAKGQHAIGPSCNADNPEALGQGLATAIQLPWSADQANRYIVVIGDNPPYPEEEKSTLALAASWATSGAHISAQQIGDAPETEAFYQQLTHNGASLKSGQSFALSVLDAMAQ